MGASGGVSGGFGDVDYSCDPVEADRQVPERGHELGGVAGPDHGFVLVECHVADPVEAIFYGPVFPDNGVQFLGAGGFCW